MEQFLSTVFPCCFPNRYARSHALGASGEQNERTPLLGDGSNSNHLGSPNWTTDGVVTPGSETTRLKRKHNSVLPSPAYDAHVLKTILDDFKSKLIAVDSATGTTVVGAGSEKGGLLLVGGDEDIVQHKVQVQQAVNSSSSTGTHSHVTPVHTLRLSLSTTEPLNDTTCSSPRKSSPKLVDIWSDPTSDSTTTSTLTPSTPAPAPAAALTSPAAILSYSAAVKRGKKSSASAKTNKQRFATSTPSKQPPSEVGQNIEQSTYEALAQIAHSKPLLHVWVLDDESTDPTP